MMKRFLAVAAILLGMSCAAQAAQTKNADSAAGTYVESLGSQALAAISDKKLSKEQKQVKLDKLFGDNVDFPWVGRFVMGQYWRQATDDQKKRYLKEYQKFLILHYTSRFTDYTGGSFKITGSRDDGDGEFTVSMQLIAEDPQNEPILVDYRVRKNGASFKIFDVIVEGVSLITTQRSEFGSVIGKNGIDYLIGQLTAKSVVAAVTPATK